MGIPFWPDWSHQQRNIVRAQVVVYSVFLLLVWVLFFSRLRWGTRLGWFGGVVGAVVLVGVLFRIRGVSGDLLPVVTWRFRSEERLSRNLKHARSKPAFAGLPLPSQDYPQFLGPHRNGVVETSPFAQNWSQQPPKAFWRQPVGPAWSGFAVAGFRAITEEQRDEQEAVVCYDLRSGDTLWSHTDQAHYHTTIAGEGPRTTPTVSGSRVLTMGATGLLNCLELETGRVLWARNVPSENGGEVGEWGVSCSPLIVGQNVIVSTGAKDGKSLAAYRLSDGAPVWTGGQDRASYSSPGLGTLDGVAQILSFNSRTVVSHDPQNGHVLWEYPWPAGHPHIATPLVLTSNQVLVSSGYGIGSELLQVTHRSDGTWKPERRWKSNRLKSKFANLIYKDGYIYGLDDGILVCLEAASGQLKWKEGRYGHGQMLLTGNILFIMAENGDAVLFEPVPEQPRELTRFQALHGKTWNPPALAGEYLLVRNDQEAACYWIAAAVPK